jgi:hypothetical protein
MPPGKKEGIRVGCCVRSLCEDMYGVRKGYGVRVDDLDAQCAFECWSGGASNIAVALLLGAQILGAAWLGAQILRAWCLVQRSWV